jgi:hypothetical protein
MHEARIGSAKSGMNNSQDSSDDRLHVDQHVVDQLTKLRNQDKFRDLPGLNTDEERKRLSAVLDALLDRLTAGISVSPTRGWVLKQFEVALAQVQYEDTEARERFGDYLEQIMDTLQIQSSDGLLNRYL